MVAFSRVLRRQAGATAKELAVVAVLIGFSMASAAGVVGYGVYVTSAGR
jgi:Flp pilus assembly pilin Flp